METTDDNKTLPRIILIILTVLICAGIELKPNQSLQNGFREAIISGSTIDSIGSTNSVITQNSIMAITSPIFVSNETYASISGDIITSEMQKVIDCESRGDHSKIGDLDYYRNGVLSPSYGIAQFQVSTFEWFKELSGYYNLDIINEKDQLILMRWAFDNGYQNHWSCYKKI